MNNYIIFLSTLVLSLPAMSIPFPGGPISATKTTDTALGNNVLVATFVRSESAIRLARLQSPMNGLDLAWTDPHLFTIHLSGKTPGLASSAMKMTPDGPFAATFFDEGSGLRVHWEALMKDGSNYLTQRIKLEATRGPVGVDCIEMASAVVPDAKVTGYTDGSPITNDKLFLGIEHPMAANGVLSPSGWTPVEMAAREFDIPVTGIEGGEVRVTFNYQKGSHRMDVLKVSLLDPAGKILSEDRHPGFTGTASRDNTYRLVPPPGATAGVLRVRIGGLPEQTDSWGSIALVGAKTVPATKVVCALPRQCVLEPGASWPVSFTIGAYPAGQMRRGFLYYLERERAHTYRQYWHYNSWYDLNITRNDHPDPLQRMTEAQCLEVIQAFGAELHGKRGVGLDGFVWDDGWDDWNSLWDFHQGFPNGFRRLKEAADKQGAGQGAWLSPWGGYGQSHDQRVAFGKSKGYETNAQGFALGGPRYYAAFRDTCVRFIRDYNMNYFKFDGIGGGMYATGAPVQIAMDLDRLVGLLGELRRANPEVFINATVGTWASPYWTWFADSVWRQGDDCAFAGEGNGRERWITYRDSLVYSRFARTSPLFPLNSIMCHGPLVGNRGAPGKMPLPAQNIGSFRNEVNMFAACGTGLGELYLTPAFLTPEAWDILAEAIRWSRSRSEILCDTHWVGGDPVREVYGYAAWHPTRGGTLVVRNPTDKPLTFILHPREVFELPEGVSTRFRFTPVLGEKREPFECSSEKPAELSLSPFQVIVMDALPFD
jgi:hypothetical protein